MGDYDYECVNAKRSGAGGTCNSGEKVKQAGAKCSKCLVSDFPV